jgi:hypothetical protein
MRKWERDSGLGEANDFEGHRGSLIEMKERNDTRLRDFFLKMDAES